MMTKEAATLRIARELPTAERAVDQALLESARLMQTLVTARIDTNTPAKTGQVALIRLANSQQSLVGASNDLLRVHAEMLKIGEAEKMLPDHNGDCPENGELDVGHLSVA